MTTTTGDIDVRWKRPRSTWPGLVGGAPDLVLERFPLELVNAAESACKMLEADIPGRGSCRVASARADRLVYFWGSMLATWFAPRVVTVSFYGLTVPDAGPLTDYINAKVPA